jgi:hypothetical protein
MGSTLRSKYYKKIDVWKKIDDKCVVRFRCYELIGEGEFCVQSADYFYYPISNEQLIKSENQQLELFLDIDPTERSETFSTLEEAILAHEAEFAE